MLFTLLQVINWVKNKGGISMFYFWSTYFYKFYLFLFHAYDCLVARLNIQQDEARKERQMLEMEPKFSVKAANALIHCFISSVPCLF